MHRTKCSAIRYSHPFSCGAMNTEGAFDPRSGQIRMDFGLESLWDYVDIECDPCASVEGGSHASGDHDMDHGKGHPVTILKPSIDPRPVTRSYPRPAL